MTGGDDDDTATQNGAAKQRIPSSAQSPCEAGGKPPQSAADPPSPPADEAIPPVDEPSQDPLTTNHPLVKPTPFNNDDPDIEAAGIDATMRHRNRSFWASHNPVVERRHVSIAQRSLRITWGWFPVNMSTGAMATLLSQQPYTFPGLLTIGKIFYILNIFLFLSFTILIATRFARKPFALITSLHHPSESFFFGGYWVAVALIIYGMQVYGVPSSGPWLVKALRVIFWMYYATAMVVAVFQYHVIFHVEKMTTSSAMPAWILPAYPFLVTGVLSSAIAKTQPTESAVQMIIGGIAGQGLGWIIAFFIYTVYLTRLINSNMPPANVRPGMYVSVGPAAYTCAGLLALGKQAKASIPSDYLGVDASFPVGEVWFAFSVPVGLFLWLIAIWFSALSSLSIIRAARKMHFSLQWWAFVFPNAGLAIATIRVGDALEAKGIKVAGAVITCLLVPLWLMCAFAHIRAVWKHDLLCPGQDVGVDDVNYTHDVRVQRRKMLKQEKRARRQDKKRGGQQAAQNGSSEKTS